MEHGHVRRFVWVSVVIGALLVAMWTTAAGAGRLDDLPTYSDADCEVLQNVDFDSGDGGGYYGKTATNASKAFGDAADDIEDEDLAGAMTTLSKVWAKVGKQKTITGAAKATVRAGRKYGDALAVFTQAQVSCVNSTLDDAFDEEDEDDSTSSTTDPDDE